MSNPKEQRKQEELREAFRCIVSLTHAKCIDNKMSCSVYQIKPFNTHWDEDTAIEIAAAVKRYLQSWVLPALEEHLGLNESLLKEMMERQHEERKQAKTNTYLAP